MSKLNAFVDGELIGEFTSNNGQLGFRYVDSHGAFPISLSMPAERQSYGNKQASAYLWGLLPDNQAAIENMAREAGTSASSVFGILAVHGRDVAGALQLLPPGEESSDSMRHSIDSHDGLLGDDDLESLLRETLNRYSTRSATRGEAFKFSVAGAQPKIALTANRDGKFLAPSKNFPTTHIIKPNLIGSDYFISEVEAVELISLRAAELAGLRTAKVDLWESPSGNLKAIVSTRYDRSIDADGVIRRIHQEDLCQALSIMPNKKYQHQFGGPGVGAISSLIRTALPRSERGQTAEDFFKALVFNVGIIGTDAHAKNYSLLLSDTVELAPLYDIISAAAHVHSDQAAYFPMKIGKTYAIDQVTIDGLAAEGKKLGIAEAEDMAIEVLTKIPSAIERAASEIGRLDLADKLIDGIMQKSPVRWLM